jgi:hypothetical protein
MPANTDAPAAEGRAALHLALILHRALRKRLKSSSRLESPARLLEQLPRIQHQAAQTGDGQLLRWLIELSAAQKELFAAIGLPMPTPDGVASSNLEVTAPVSL